jgi:hypothetical protein
MRINEIRDALHAQPFRPFTVRVSDGREYPVEHPDFLAISPSGRTIIVYGADDLHDPIETMMITSLHIGNGRQRRKRR